MTRPQTLHLQNPIGQRRVGPDADVVSVEGEPAQERPGLGRLRFVRNRRLVHHRGGFSAPAPISRSRFGASAYSADPAWVI